MNRQQRRAQARQGRVEMIDLRDITYPWQMSTEECETMLANRLIMNLQETKHPFHHRTANGVIVEPDPTLEYYLGRLTLEKQAAIRQNWLTRAAPDAPQAQPVNRNFYEREETWRRRG